MTPTRTLASCVFTFVATSAVTAGAEGPASGAAADRWADHWHVGIETSPAFFAMGGYFGDLAVVAPALPRWRFVASVYALDIPTAFIDSANPGWTQRDEGVGLGAQRTFGHRERGGWYAGLNLGVQRRRAARSDGSGAAIEEDVEVEGGFRWFPVRGWGLTITPSFGFAVPLHRSAAPVVDGMTYVYKPFSIIPGVAIGWDF